MKTSILIQTEPTVEPVSVDEFKTFARIDNDDEETAISNLLVATRQATEKYLGRALLEQTIYYNLDEWEERRIELPYPSLLSVTGVYLRNEDGTFTEYDSDNYYVVSDGIPGSIVIKTGSTMPDNTHVDYAKYQIRYKAGYGDAAVDVPEAIKQAILVWANNGYANRVISPEPPIEVRQALSLYRVERLK